jgi:hypothetical protein
MKARGGVEPYRLVVKNSPSAFEFVPTLTVDLRGGREISKEFDKSRERYHMDDGAISLSHLVLPRPLFQHPLRVFPLFRLFSIPSLPPLPTSLCPPPARTSSCSPPANHRSRSGASSRRQFVRSQYLRVRRVSLRTFKGSFRNRAESAGSQE